MKRFLLSLALLLAPAGAALAAPAVPDDVLKAVDAYYNDDGRLSDEASSHEGEQETPPHLTPPRAMFRKVDVNRDGVPDWWIDYGKADNGSYFCGTGGCVQQVYVSRPDGRYALAFDTNVRWFKLGRRGGETVLDLDFHGSTCGVAGVVECPRSYAWEPARSRFIERPTRKGDGWLIYGPAQLIPPDATAFPAEVKAQLARRQVQCAALGGDFAEDGSANDLPDLNGDGVRDWVVGPVYSYCELPENNGEAPLLATTFLVSQPDGTFAPAFEAVDPTWGIALGSPSTLVLLEGEGCLFENSCKRIPLTWTGKALAPAAP